MSPASAEPSRPASVTRVGAGDLAVKGPMTLHTVGNLVDTLDEVLKEDNAAIAVDLSGVEGADSAAVALMIEWLRRTRARRGRLHFRNVPQQIEKIAAVSGVSDLIDSAGS